MQIDWVTTAAQVVNFLVLVLLLKQFLYGPIVRAMDQREKDITRRYEDIRSKMQTVEQQEAYYQAKLCDLEDTRGERLSALQAEIDQERAALLDKARADVKRLTHSWKTDLEREKAAFLTQARQAAASQSLVLARKALQDLADVDLEQRMAEQLVERIRNLRDDDRHALVRSRDRGVEVTSSHEIPEHLRERIASALSKAIAPDLEVSFVVLPHSGWGISLVAEGLRLEWSIEAYLAEFEQALAGALQQFGTVEHA